MILMTSLSVINSIHNFNATIASLVFITKIHGIIHSKMSAKDLENICCVNTSDKHLRKSSFTYIINHKHLTNIF